MSKTTHAIYPPRGPAREYSPLALNLFTGCSHGCKYCYVPRCLRRDREEFHASMTVREGVLEQLVKDAKRLRGDPRQVLLSFTSDPYPQGRPDLWAVTREVLTGLRQFGLHWQVLTKGGEQATEDFDLYGRGDSFGVTLTCGEKLAAVWEPNAAPPGERMANLWAAHRGGIETFVSAEPVIDPAHIVRSIGFVTTVDLWRIGAWSNQPREVVIDWPAFGRDLADVLTATGARYYIKQSLRRYMPPGFPPSTEEQP